MGFDFEERKSLLYADLFKLEESRENIMPQWRSLSLSPSSSASDSSLSGFTTPKSDDADFAAELSRQMVEYMLQEEEEKTPVSKYGLDTTKLKDQSGDGDYIGVSRGRRAKELS
ncbi:hypothetical protein AAHA92_21830 [Salvia divinorum]|uniref:Uncharacterized protein n=1 Tax=Salvia divinorum TaxID=28513 RepID=A0ABD1GPN2_SALDI